MRFKVKEDISELERFLNSEEPGQPGIIRVRIETLRDRENFFRIVSNYRHVYVSPAGVKRIVSEGNRISFRDVEFRSRSSLPVVHPGGNFERFISYLKRGIDTLKKGEVLVVNPPETLIDPEDRERLDELITQLVLSGKNRVIVLEANTLIANLHFTLGPDSFKSEREDEEKERIFSFVGNEVLRADLLKVVSNLSLDEAEYVAFKLRGLDSVSPYRVLKAAFDAKGELLSQAGVIYRGVRDEVAVGYEDITDSILQRVNANKSLSLNVILSGVPGTGKTLFAYSLSREFFLPLFEFDPASLRDSLFGKTEKKVKEAVAALRKASPCVILIDEYEKLMHVPPGSSVADTLLATRVEVLRLLEDRSRESILVATSNNPELISPEELRRFHFRFFMDLPCGERALKILSYYLPHVEKMDEEEREWLKRKLDRLFSGQLIKDIAEEITTRMRVEGREFSFETVKRVVEGFISIAVSQKLKALELRSFHSAGGFVRI